MFSSKTLVNNTFKCPLVLKHCPVRFQGRKSEAEKAVIDVKSYFHIQSYVQCYKFCTTGDLKQYHQAQLWFVKVLESDTILQTAQKIFFFSFLSVFTIHCLMCVVCFQPPVFDKFSTLVKDLQETTKSLHQISTQFDPVFVALDLSALSLTQPLTDAEVGKVFVQ